MILVDTSIWVDHLRGDDRRLAGLLDAGLVLTHPFVIGELALGNLRQRDRVLDYLVQMPRADVATDREVLHFINQNALNGSGIGYVDAHLLASARLGASVSLLTRDKGLLSAARRLNLSTD